MNISFEMTDKMVEYEKGLNAGWLAADVYTKYNTYRTKIILQRDTNENHGYQDYEITYDLNNCEQILQG